MKFKRSEVVAVFQGLGFTAADKWTRDRLLTKIQSLPKSVADDQSIGEPDLDNLCDELIAAVRDGDPIDVVNDVEEVGDLESPNGNGKSESIKPASVEKKKRGRPAKKSAGEATSTSDESNPGVGKKQKTTAPKEKEKEGLCGESEITAPCVRVDQNGKEFILVALPVSLLCDVSYVAVRGVSEESTAVQRLLTKSRISSIREYKDRGGHFPGSVVINWVNKDSIRLSKSEVTIQNVARSAQLIDGQHRMEGLRRALEAGGKDIQIPVALYFDLAAEDAANIFLSLNTEQKPVPKKFVYEIYGLASDYIVDDRVNKTRELALAVLDGTRSPLKTSYKGALSKSRIGINLATAISGLKPLVGDKGQFKLLGVGTVENQAKLLLALFGAIKDGYGKDWDDDDNAFRYAAGFLGAIDYFRSTLLPYMVRNKISTSSAVGEFMDSDADLIMMSGLKGLGGAKARKVVAEKLAKVFNLPEDDEDEDSNS